MATGISRAVVDNKSWRFQRPRSMHLNAVQTAHQQNGGCEGRGGGRGGGRVGHCMQHRSSCLLQNCVSGTSGARVCPSSRAGLHPMIFLDGRVRNSPRPTTRTAAAAAAAVAAGVVASPPSIGAPAGAVGGGISEIVAVAIGYLVLAGACFRSVPQVEMCNP